MKSAALHHESSANGGGGLDQRSHFFTATDGLRLHARIWSPAQDDGRLPAVCLTGLTRNTDDFARLAAALATGSTPRRVVALDYRGRGLSDHDIDWHHYDLATERADMLLLLAGLGIGRAHFIGTSRGGLHVMALAAEHRDLIAAIVLNDIGPVLDPAGLARIKGYIGRPAAPRSLAEAVRMMKLGDAAAGFDGLDDDEWRYFAATTFGDDETDLRLRYDPQLARTLDGFDLTKPLPDSWALFDKLRPAPILTIRGANSDLLSAETLEAMTRRWPGNRGLVVPGQAHAPLLADEVTIAAIAGFLAEADAE